MAPGTAGAESGHHPVVARIQRANRVCVWQLGFRECGSGSGDSERIVGNTEVVPPGTGSARSCEMDGGENIVG